MSSPERNEQIYVTRDGKQWLRINWPFGLIEPPKIELAEPMVGPVTFFHAECYRLPIPAAALVVPATPEDQP